MPHGDGGAGAGRLSIWDLQCRLGVEVASTQDRAEDEGRGLGKPPGASVVLRPRSFRFLSPSPGLESASRPGPGNLHYASSAGAHL